MGSVLSTVLSNVATYLTGEGGLYTVLGDTGGFFSTYLVQPSDSQAAEILDFDINTLGMPPLTLSYIIVREGCRFSRLFLRRGCHRSLVS